MKRIRLSPAGRRDLDEIWIYSARESGSEQVATRLIERITDEFALFARFPFIGRNLEEGRHSDVRTFPMDRFVIFYRPSGDETRILRVIHASRDALAEFLEQ